MGKVFLTIGAVIGGLIVAFGGLVLLGTLTDNTLSSTDRNDGIYVSIFIIGFGLVLFVPCLFFLVRSRSDNALALLSQGMAYGSAGVGLTTAYAPVDLNGSYLQWFGYCQREIGGNAIALHAATMAAMAEAGAGNSGGAPAAARQAAARASSLAGAQEQRPKTPTAKIRQLARIGAGTLPLLEPAERVSVSLYGTDTKTQIWHFFFGWIGMLIAMSQGGAFYITVTDRRVVALTGSQLSKAPTALAFVVPLSMVSEARFRGRLFGTGIFTITRMDGGRTRLRLRSNFKREGVVAQNALASGAGLTPQPQSPAIAPRGNF